MAAAGSSTPTRTPGDSSRLYAHAWSARPPALPSKRTGRPHVAAASRQTCGLIPGAGGCTRRAPNPQPRHRFAAPGGPPGREGAMAEESIDTARLRQRVDEALRKTLDTEDRRRRRSRDRRQSRGELLALRRHFLQPLVCKRRSPQSSGGCPDGAEAHRNGRDGLPAVRRPPLHRQGHHRGSRRARQARALSATPLGVP